MYNHKNFNENTRVQVPASIHLVRLGYQYLDNISEKDYEHNTNILKNIFTKSFKRLNPNTTDSDAELIIQKIVQIAKNDDLGRFIVPILNVEIQSKIASLVQLSTEKKAESKQLLQDAKRLVEEEIEKGE